MVPEGKHKAKVLNYGIRAIKKGDNAGQPAPTIIFEVEGHGTVFWQGNFSDKARKIALKALYHCGLQSPHMIAALADGPKGGALNLEQEVEIDVAHETIKEVNGEMKTYAKVAWVNPVGGSIRDTMSKEEFAPFVAGLGLQGDFVAIAKEQGYKTTTVATYSGAGMAIMPPNSPSVTTQQQPAAFGEDIPF